MKSSATKNKNLNKSFSSLGYARGGAISGVSISGVSIPGGSNKEPEKFKGNYFQWIKNELTGWDTLPWAMFTFGVGFELALLFVNPISWQSLVAFAGVFFGMWCTVAMSSGGTDKNGHRVISHSINGLMGAISVVAYIVVNAVAGHWFSIVDQLIFFSLIDVELMFTWRTWGRGKNRGVNVLSKKGWIYVILAILIAWGVLYPLGVQLQDTNPIWDALTLAIGGVASWLCFRRYTSTYTLWLCSDFVNIVLWFTTLQQGFAPATALPMLVMTLFYLATAIYGKFVWRVSSVQ
ncbi:nicotinamide mononucleotide transporter [Lactobacillus phage ATCCB]|nr:nicotinamide mononucleotide transporter [Lactobacillus phage ATCCB]